MAISTKIKKPAALPSPSLDATQSDVWRPPAPPEVVEAYTSGEAQAGWEAWTDYLDARRGTPLIDKLLPNGDTCLLWGLPPALVGGETEQLLRRLGRIGSLSRRDRRRLSDLAADWLDAASLATTSPAHACECLAWAYALPRLPDSLGENLWWKLLNHLTAVSCDAGLAAVGAKDPSVWQLLAGELPLALAYGLPEIRDCHDQSQSAMSTIAAGLTELLDVDGLPSLQVAPQLAALMASWTRSRAIAERIGEELWQEPASRRYELAVVSLARLQTVDANFWRAAAQFELEKSTRQLLRELAADPRGLGKTPDNRKLPSPAFHSEEHQRALLRPNWLRKSPRLEVFYSESHPHVELSAGGELLCSGPWRCEVSLDGEARAPSGPWEPVCWFSDADVDFLEIEAPLGSGLLIQRQFLLARQDNMLLLADAIICDQPARIDYRSALALCAHTGFHGADETRDGFLIGAKTRALVLPLALPEWRSDSRRGSLEVTSDGLTLRQSHQGRAAYAPLLFDLDRRRSERPNAWRQLTVAELRTAQTHDVAVGYRGQIGKTNWLVYRSLADPSIRSLLGQQVKAEFLFARMKADGGCARLLEIESVDT